MSQLDYMTADQCKTKSLLVSKVSLVFQTEISKIYNTVCPSWLIALVDQLGSIMFSAESLMTHGSNL